MFTINGSALLSNTWGKPRLTVDETAVTLDRKPSIFGRVQSVIPFERIAAVNLGHGLAASSITIESTGGGKHTLIGASQEDAEAAVKLIREKLAGLHK